MNTLEKLTSLRSRTGAPRTTGLTEQQISNIKENRAELESAVDEAFELFEQVLAKHPEVATTPEAELLQELQSGFLNFYLPDTVCPYVPLTARGPWIVTLYGAVLYDTGGYGMIGLGHNPPSVLEAMKKDQVMANIMTPSLLHADFMAALRNKIGYLRPDSKCPYDKFLCMNSGSESMAVALTISDAYTKKITAPGARHEGKESYILSLTKSFHGRTFRPAFISNSTRPKYMASLASFGKFEEQITVDPNDLNSLSSVWKKLNDKGLYIEALVLEPVMGEGNPGMAITREFYDLARKLTTDNGSLLIVDSIQAGLRAQGVLSIVDYPDFLDCESPDMETFSKALNAAQYPLSVLAMKEHVASAYAIGTYGNTMTSNPRALDTAIAVLDKIDSQLTANVRERGEEFVSKLKLLAKKHPDKITKVQGTGLLVSAELAETIDVVAENGVEQRMRMKGVNVIHGGKNSLRFTPWLYMSSSQVDLICDVLEQTLIETSTSRAL